MISKTFLKELKFVENNDSAFLLRLLFDDFLDIEYLPYVQINVNLQDRFLLCFEKNMILNKKYINETIYENVFNDMTTKFWKEFKK